MAEDKVLFYLFRLAFEPYLKEMGACQVNDEDLQKMTDKILSNVVDISFQDGNGEMTTAFGSASNGKMAYVVIEKKVNRKTDIEKTLEQGLISEYPDFTMVLDGRYPQQEGILVGIEHNRKSFASIETVRKGLEKYFNEHVARECCCTACLRQLSSSDKFWKQVVTTKEEGHSLKSLCMKINNLENRELLAELPHRQALLYQYCIGMCKDIGADAGGLSFLSSSDCGLDVERTEANLGMMIALACNQGFKVEATFDNCKKITSDVAAPITFLMDRKDVEKPKCEEKEELEAANQKQWGALAREFDAIKEKLKQIKEQKKNEETRHIAKR